MEIAIIVLTVRLFVKVSCLFLNHFFHIDQSYSMRMQLHVCYESRFAVPEDEFCGYIIIQTIDFTEKLTLAKCKERCKIAPCNLIKDILGVIL